MLHSSLHSSSVIGCITFCRNFWCVSLWYLLRLDCELFWLVITKSSRTSQILLTDRQIWYVSCRRDLSAWSFNFLEHKAQRSQHALVLPSSQQGKRNYRRTRINNYLLDYGTMKIVILLATILSTASAFTTQRGMYRSNNKKCCVLLIFQVS